MRWRGASSATRATDTLPIDKALARPNGDDRKGDGGSPGNTIPRVVLCGGALAETPLGASLAARLRKRARELWGGGESRTRTRRERRGFESREGNPRGAPR